MRDNASEMHGNAGVLHLTRSMVPGVVSILVQGHTQTSANHKTQLCTTPDLLDLPAVPSAASGAKLKGLHGRAQVAVLETKGRTLEEIERAMA